MHQRSLHEVLVATSNPHKLDEIRAVLGGLGVVVLGLDALAANFPEPDENAVTFEENARIKAIAYARMTGRTCLADDSGLEVDALDGEPGVRSARWSGIGTTRAERDAANNELLIARLRGVPSERRAARFVCTMCLAAPDGRVLAATRGEFPGVIAAAPRGTNGFGYDPLLWLPAEGRSSAELTNDEKNARSHRGHATRAMAKELRARGLLAP
ncbi:MAG: RdgB/HAM1 family non-canonical purine NTP pyrophosphatase [Phycisphaerae bacterium]|nr:RdgB/HAM1 family non-canonical purine NTP pyrophosphatase [Phycisphaerae bacterium]